MNDRYTIKIESVVISPELINELANSIDEIHNKVKNSSSDVVDYTFKRKHGQETTVHTKEECSKQKISTDLDEISFSFYSNHKSVTVSLHFGLTAPDSKIYVSSDDKIWNRGVAMQINEIIKEYERKFNKWIRKWSSKIIVGLLILGLISFIYYVVSLLSLNDSHNTTLDDSQYLSLDINLFLLTSLYPSVFSVWALSFFFPAIEHKKMIRVRIRKIIGGATIFIIGGLIIEIFTKAVSTIFS